MLTPSRFMQLDYSLIAVTAQVIACLKERKMSTLVELLRYAKHASSQIAENDILLAVTFLYATGKVDVDTLSGSVWLVA